MAARRPSVRLSTNTEEGAFGSGDRIAAARGCAIATSSIPLRDIAAFISRGGDFRWRRKRDRESGADVCQLWRGGRVVEDLRRKGVVEELVEEVGFVILIVAAPASTSTSWFVAVRSAGAGESTIG